MLFMVLSVDERVEDVAEGEREWRGEPATAANAPDRVEALLSGEDGVDEAGDGDGEGECARAERGWKRDARGAMIVAAERECC